MIEPRVISIFTDWHDRGNNFGGCGWYRIVQPMRHLPEVDIKGKIQRIRLPQLRRETAVEMYKRIFTKYDLMFLQHCDDPRGIAQVFGARDYFKKRVIIDLDDDYLHIDDWSPVIRHCYPGSDVERFTTRSLEFADALCVSTEELKKVYSPYNKNIYVIPNTIDLDYWDYNPSVSEDGIIRIGWAGSYTHEVDLMECIDAIRTVLMRHKNVQFVHCGYDSDLFHTLPKNQVRYVLGTKTFKRWPKWLARLKFDIGIAPLANITFNRSKSAVKYFEYSAYGIPGVYAGFQGLPYFDKIQNGANGFLAIHYREWVKYLEQLIESKELRDRVGSNAKEDIKKYTVDTEAYKKMFQEVWGRQ